MAQENKTALLKELSLCFAQLKTVDKTALTYLSKNATQAIKEAKITLTNSAPDSSEPGSNPNVVLNHWFDNVIKEVKSEESQLIQGKSQSFNPTIAKKYVTTTLNGSSKEDIKKYIFGLVCTQISGNSLCFSESFDVTNYVKSIKKAVIDEILRIGYSDLPPKIFLAEKLILLYVESTRDSMDMFEAGKLKAGYIYFYIKAFYNRRHLESDEKHYAQTRLEFLYMKPQSPYIDDVAGPENVKKILGKYYNDNFPLVYLPMKMKLVYEITIAEEVGVEVVAGGLSLYNTVKCERGIGEKWKLITQTDKTVSLPDFYSRIDEFLDEKLLQNEEFTIKNLVND